LISVAPSARLPVCLHDEFFFFFFSVVTFHLFFTGDFIVFDRAGPNAVNTFLFADEHPKTAGALGVKITYLQVRQRVNKADGSFAPTNTTGIEQ
jgi:hypothetical protein